MSTPVSWLVIERGWTVVASDGEEVGEVEEVTGDSTAGIFNGLSVSTGFLDRPRYVPSERVAEISDGCVRLDLTRAEFERLEEFEEPPASLDIDPAEASATDRVADVFVDPEMRPRAVTPWRRVLSRIFRREPRSGA